MCHILGERESERKGTREEAEEKEEKRRRRALFVSRGCVCVCLSLTWRACVCATLCFFCFPLFGACGGPYVNTRKQQKQATAS